ncbi:AraC family transcriptional regulator [Dyella terrae]|uniref:AraC family transcriptional regulator n=1 Tax=Dyella terrae TaxID=522259 RepID=UPI001EFE9A1F|nr:AraC family transcriptional regulator [Dyella terrae]
MLVDALFMRDSSNMASDPLSDVLELVQARCIVSGRLLAGGAWGRRCSNLDAIKFCAAIEGGCWCYMDGMAEPVRFDAGDVLVTNGTRSLILASDPALIATAVNTPLVADQDGIYRLGAGSDLAMLAGFVHIDDRRQSLLLDGLPPMLHVHGSMPDAAIIAWLLKQLVREMEPAERPGRTVILAELSQLLFVNTLRAYLAHAPEDDTGWLKGLGDKRLACVLSRMHAAPERAWSLEDLAQVAGMSRTSFAVRFREVMGMPPLTYLTNWRMHVAERQLLAGATVAEVADAIGYTSESAFSHAFKRSMGIAPGRYRKTVEGPHEARRELYEEDSMADSF